MSSTDNNNISEHVHVYCRQRYHNKDSPRYDEDGEEDGPSPVSLTNDTCNYSTAKNNQKFLFDGCFQGNSSQEDVFTSVAKPLVDSVINGYSGAIICYGCTGAGKL